MTIKEIAKLAGVSTATVSLVLNNVEGRVSNEVRDKVLQVVKENDFIPNKIARSLREKRTKTLGVLTEDITSFRIPGVLSGINHYLENTDFHVVLNNLSLLEKTGNRTDKVLNFKHEIEDAINLFVEARIDGMIYIGWQDRDIRDLIRPLSCPVVYAYCFSSLDDRSWISYDNDLAMEEILDHVLSLGHKRIAFIGGVDENCYPTAKRLKVYQDKLAAANIPLRREYIKFGDWSFNDGKRFYRDFRSLEEPPTAILSLNDYMAAGVIEESMTTDRKVLDEISVVGFNGLEFVEFLYPSLASMRLPLEEIGYRAAEQLVSEVQNKDYPHKRELLKCEFINGSSLRPNPRA